jgi:hypothetical protein
MDRVVRARRLVRFEFGLALCAVALAGFGFIAMPNMGGTMYTGSAWWEDLILPAGIVGVVVGFAWMIRIIRSAPEDEARGWRYRDRD